jgi:cellobiose phosphorylase
VFRTQNLTAMAQWFMFFERRRGIRPPDSRSDIVFWPLPARRFRPRRVSLLDEVLPFSIRRATIRRAGDHRAHVERALSAIAGRLIPGTSRLAATATE